MASTSRTGRWHRIGHDVGAGGDREPEPAQVVVHVVIAVPAAVILRQPELELRTAGKAQRPLQDEHRLPRHVAAAGADVVGPRGFVLAVDGEGRSGPVTRLRSVLSKKIVSSGVSGGLTPAVAETIFTPSKPADPSPGAASTTNSVRPNDPLIERPGPAQGSAGSLSSSSRTALILARPVSMTNSVACFVGA